MTDDDKMLIFNLQFVYCLLLYGQKI